MFKLIHITGNLIIQIVLVVIAVLVFSYFDPFGILGSNKQRLKDTPVSVRSIKEIGKLITAEYYGEVVSSSPEYLNNEDDSLAQTFEQDLKELHNDFITTIKEIANTKPKIKSKNIYKIFKSDYQFVRNDVNFPLYVYYQWKWDNKPNKKFKEKDFDKRISENKEKRFIRKLVLAYRNDPNALKTIQNTAILQPLFTSFSAIATKKRDRALKKRRLVLLGRGWVKAGFDFETFDASNFEYNAGQKTVHFIGLKPEILSHTINPWFIPEEGVEGFEFLVVQKRARKDPDMLLKVKKECLNKLFHQALKRDILGKAQENAKVNLQAFFSLLMDDDIKVVFHNSALTYTQDVILEDSSLNNAEFLSVDIAIKRTLDDVEIENAVERGQAFTQLLNRASVNKEVLGTVLDSVHRFTSLIYTICQDSVLDASDSLLLANARKELSSKVSPLDSIWVPANSSKPYTNTFIKSQLTLDYKKTLNIITKLISRVEMSPIGSTDIPRIVAPKDSSLSVENWIDTTFKK